ncbi:MAG: ABC transporter permease [Pseudomonadota bacterium]
MTATILRVMFLSLVRDRGALFLTFALPPAMYLIFAAIFSGTGQGDPELRVGLFEAGPATEIEASIRAMGNQTLSFYSDRDLMALELAEGRLDGAIVLQGGGERPGESAIVVLADPGKKMAAAVLAGRLTEMLAREHPTVLLERQAAMIEGVAGPYTQTQSARLEATIAQPDTLGDGVPLVARETVGAPGQVDPTVSYYAAAITIMFLLLSATQTASGLIDERRSGILDRFASVPGGIDTVVLGRALFLGLQALVQAAIVFAVAALAYSVPVTAHFSAWAAATLVVAAGVAGLGIFAAAACATRAQAQTLATFIVLALSAIGGSMVPRFLMPDWLRDLGFISPNAWAIDLYQGLLTRDATLMDMWIPFSAFVVVAVFGTGAAVILSRWRLRL